MCMQSLCIETTTQVLGWLGNMLLQENDRKMEGGAT